MKIGVLQTGKAPEELAAKYGEYPDFFARLLDGNDFVFETWAVVDGVFPDGPEAADGWLITGSRHGAYEDHAWIAPLEELIREIYGAGRPLVGICFGHQIIAQALGGRVEKFAGGWAVGRQVYDWNGEEVALNAWHQDQVVVAPEGARRHATSAFCENAALVYGDRVYSVQAHPEFDTGWVADLAEARGRGVVPDPLIETALSQTDAHIDRERLAHEIAHFFKHRSLP